MIRAPLAAGARDIVPDMRGFGASDKARYQAAYADSTMPRGIVALIEHLRLAAVDVIGFTKGAGTGGPAGALSTKSLQMCTVHAGLGPRIIRPTQLTVPLQKKQRKAVMSPSR